MKLLLVLSVGATAAVPLLAPSPAQALTACASVTTTLTAAQSCTIDDNGTTYFISIQTGTFPNAFPSPSTTTMFWWGDAIKAGSAASAVGGAFGFSLQSSIHFGPLFAYVDGLVRPWGNEIGWVSLDFTSLGVSLPNVTLGGATTQ